MESPNFQSEILQQRIVLPDGSNYHWAYLNLDTDIDTSVDTIQQIMVRNPGQEIRIAMDSPVHISALAQTLEWQMPQAQISHGKTTFFECSLSTPGVMVPRWSVFKNSLSYRRVNTANQDDRSVVHDLMIASFAHTKRDGEWRLNSKKQEAIEENFYHVLRDPRLYNAIYVVEQREEVVGSFTLLNFPSLGEVQLHAVAGRVPELPGYCQMKDKLMVLTSAALDIASRRDKAQKFTFSSSGAAWLYEQLGFERSSIRDGLVITTEADLGY